MNDLLTEIKIIFPRTTFSNVETFMGLFDGCSTSPSSIYFPTQPADDYYPKTSFEFSDKVAIPEVIFLSSSGEEILKVPIVNETGSTWKSKYSYEHIELEEFVKRAKINNIEFQYYDHLGFNLPWEKGIHPKIENIINTLKNKSLLHSFPNNENWYFIIPGKKSEIAQETEVDYELDRRPKFEIVNFLTCSTPLVQIDLAVNAKYEDYKKLFPEAIHDDDLKNLWVYLKNSSGIDICFILNEEKEKSAGWTEFFKDHRTTKL